MKKLVLVSYYKKNDKQIHFDVFRVDAFLTGLEMFSELMSQVKKIGGNTIYSHTDNEDEIKAMFSKMQKYMTVSDYHVTDEVGESFCVSVSDQRQSSGDGRVYTTISKNSGDGFLGVLIKPENGKENVYIDINGEHAFLVQKDGDKLTIK